MRPYVFPFVLVVIFLVSAAEKEVLKPGRELSWKKTSNPNVGVDISQPEQVHLAFGGSADSLTVTWLTFNDTGESFVDYGVEDTFGKQAAATTTRYRDTLLNNWRYVHRATIMGIEPGKKYYYRVGSEQAFSNVFSFRGLKERPDGGYRFAVYGDFGYVNARSLGRLQNLTQYGDLDMILHAGDFAYDLSVVGDEFFRNIEPIASRVPYMGVPGNHESYLNFTEYRNRFTMPGGYQNIFYSFDLGLTHFIGFSTEIYYDFFDKQNQLQTQYNWLVNDLKLANKNRGKVPWIIVMGHRPMYCTNNQLVSDCGTDNPVRNGQFGLEDLFYQQGVDLQFYGHEHNYERLYPVYKNVAYKNATQPYTDPPAPVHVVIGSAGCQEMNDIFKRPEEPWDAARSSDYGFSRMQIFNRTHLYFEQIRAYDGIILDSFIMIKNRHGPYTAQQFKQLKKHGIKML